MNMQFEKPMFDRALEMWREIDFIRSSEPLQQVSEYMAYLRAAYDNGRVECASFEIPASNEFREFSAQGHLHEAYFFDRFWKTAGVYATFPYALRELKFYTPEVFAELHPVELAGSLAGVLARGGAYDRNAIPGTVALQKATEAAHELLASDYDRPRVYFSGAAWSAFFHDVAWDCSWVVVDNAKSRIHVILATDSD